MKRFRRIGIASLAATIAACASSPPTLVALPVPSLREGHQKVGPTSDAIILLRPVVLPGYLDNYPVIIARSGNTLVVSKDTEWAEPLRDAVARALRAALSQRLGASRVLIDGDGRIPDADLSVEFLALDPQRGALLLDAKWTFSCTARNSRGRADRTFLEVRLGDASPAGIAAATAEALERFADVLAAQAPCEGPELAR
jgi:uncharacterized lipoprotein YmbA